MKKKIHTKLNNKKGKSKYKNNQKNKKYSNKSKIQVTNKINKESNKFNNKNIFKKGINILEEEENNFNKEINNIDDEKNNFHKKIKINIFEKDKNTYDKNINNIESKFNNSGKGTIKIEKQNNISKGQDKEKKKLNILLGRKRKLVNYKQHSLKYNELNKLLKEEEIQLNINSLHTYINLNPYKIKGHFIGILYIDNKEQDNSNCDFVIEINNQNNKNFNNFIVYSSKTFQKKLSFLENAEGQLYILYKGYAAFYKDDSIKIYHFSKNNTNYDIFQKIMLPEELHHTILFPFKFIHDNNYYFFHKMFSLRKNNKITLYKFNKDEQKDENDFSIRGNTFIEDKTLKLDFEFIWFAQKNDNELLFFYEENYIFKVNCYDLSKDIVTQTKIFKLIQPYNIKIANYADDLINKRFLALSNHNLLYIIDTEKWDISVVKELDVIEYFKVFNDNTLWTIESGEKAVTIENNKKRNISFMYVRQYKLDNEMQELIKIGERKLCKHHSISNKVVQINNKTIILFVEGKKLIMLN